ncbi:hypothetical protein [Candidatus Arsenophonus triatominarum]|uniref:hypothetical protein n=1 Tax=Candidatus Arsenophonus triatominarum TaxID=57911 RepID=UPI0007C4F8D4|nr:hypothetical protein [Candidatus Arsenophonus triatominarum]
MINKERLLRDNRLCKAIIGLSVEELKNLAAEFSACYLIYRKKNRKDHERQMGAGQKGFIPNPLDKLLFILLSVLLNSEIRVFSVIEVNFRLF